MKKKYSTRRVERYSSRQEEEIVVPPPVPPIPRVTFVPRNRSQALARKLFADNSVLFLVGPAGGGKTAAAIGLALSQAVPMLARVSVCRPAVEASKGLGFAKGDPYDKYGPWVAPVVENASKFVQGGAIGHLDLQPMATLQGRTFDGPAILDEAQNCTSEEILIFLTRMGATSKLLISGDSEQAVIPNSGLAPWIRCLEGVPGVAVVRFAADENLRHPLVQEFIRRRPR